MFLSSVLPFMFIPLCFIKALYRVLSNFTVFYSITRWSVTYNFFFFSSALLYFIHNFSILCRFSLHYAATLLNVTLFISILRLQPCAPSYQQLGGVTDMENYKTTNQHTQIHPLNPQKAYFSTCKTGLVKVSK